MDQCPNCDNFRTFDEWQFDKCYCCGYPNTDNEEPELDEVYYSVSVCDFCDSTELVEGHSHCKKCEVLRKF